MFLGVALWGDAAVLPKWPTPTGNAGQPRSALEAIAEHAGYCIGTHKQRAHRTGIASRIHRLRVVQRVRKCGQLRIAERQSQRLNTAVEVAITGLEAGYRNGGLPRRALNRLTPAMLCEGSLAGLKRVSFALPVSVAPLPL